MAFPLTQKRLHIKLPSPKRRFLSTHSLTILLNTYIIAVLLIWLMEMYMKKTTLLIDEKLLNAAIEAIGVRTKKEAVEAGLRSLVRHRNREELRKELGTFEMDLTLKELERLRDAE